MPCPVSIRPATAADLPRAASMNFADEHMAREPAYGTERLLAKILCGDVLLATQGDEAIGYARVDMLWPEECPLLAWIYVEGAHRGRGVGSMLEMAVKAALRARGHDRMLVSACSARPSMLRRFERRGLAPCGSLDFGTGVVETFF